MGPPPTVLRLASKSADPNPMGLDVGDKQAKLEEKQQSADDNEKFQFRKPFGLVQHSPTEQPSRETLQNKIDEEGQLLSLDEIGDSLKRMRQALLKPQECRCGCAEEYKALVKMLQGVVGGEVHKLKEVKDLVERNGLTLSFLDEFVHPGEMDKRVQEAEQSVVWEQEDLANVTKVHSTKKVNLEKMEVSVAEANEKVTASKDRIFKLSQLLTAADQHVKTLEADIDEGAIDKLKERLKGVRTTTAAIVEDHAVAKWEYERAETAHEKIRRKGTKLSVSMAECTTVSAELSVKLSEGEKRLEERGIEMAVREADVNKRLADYVRRDRLVQKNIAGLTAYVDERHKRERDTQDIDGLEDELEMLMLSLRAHEMAWAEKLRFVKREMEEYELEASLRPEAIKNLEEAVSFLLAVPEARKPRAQRNQKMLSEKARRTRFDSPTNASHLARGASLGELSSPTRTTSTVASSPSPLRRGFSSYADFNEQKSDPSEPSPSVQFRQTRTPHETSPADLFVRHPIRTVAEEVDEEAEDVIENSYFPTKDPEAPPAGKRGPKRRPRRPHSAEVSISRVQE